MQIKDSIAVVTGGASGIGRALAWRFTTEGARHVVVVDIDADGARVPFPDEHVHTLQHLVELVGAALPHSAPGCKDLI